MTATDEQLRRWAATWRVTGSLLTEIRRSELATLTHADARRAAEDMAALAALLPPKQGGSGLVEQQRLFGLLDR